MMVSGPLSFGRGQERLCKRSENPGDGSKYNESSASRLHAVAIFFNRRRARRDKIRAKWCAMVRRPIGG
jgi:hypothetical protein